MTGQICVITVAVHGSLYINKYNTAFDLMPCALVQSTDEWKEPTGTIKSYIIVFKESLQCLRASTTLHEAQINEAEIHVQLRFLYFPK